MESKKSEIKKIRIKSDISKETVWYYGMSGKIFNVISENETSFIVKKENNETYFVFKEDAEIIKNPELCH